MPPANLTFLGGVREIGGNKIVVQDGPDRILFDFGQSFSPRYDEYYVNFLQPRSSSPVKDRLEFGLLPRVTGLYSEEALAGSDLPYQSPEYHGVFVSHAHADHASYLSLIDPTIPVYLGKGTKSLLDAIESSGRQKYGIHPWRTMPERGSVRVGQIEVEAVPVDHSIPFAYGFFIRTSAGTVVYTGDFRQHGPRAEQTARFLERASHEDPVALIIEGTRAGPDARQTWTEAGVRTAVDELLTSTPRLAISSCYPRDIDRLTTLYEAAVAADREFVVSLRTAHLLSTVDPGAVPGMPVPGRAPNLRVYVRTKKRYYKWEEPFLDDGVDADWVRSRSDRLLLSLDLQHFGELIDLQPAPGSAFVHSMSEPFSEDDLEDDVLHNWLAHFQLSFHQMHASGHCSGPELLEITRQLGPRIVLPVHTEAPEAFRALGPSVRPPVLGEPVVLPP